MDEDRGAFGAPEPAGPPPARPAQADPAHAGPPGGEQAGVEEAGVEVLRDVAQSMGAVRQSLEHGDRAGAIHAAQHLLRALERLPASREEYERLCEEADRLLAADPRAWDPGHA